MRGHKDKDHSHGGSGQARRRQVGPETAARPVENQAQKGASRARVAAIGDQTWRRLQRIAIVTGAGTGMAKAAALALLGDGWSVALAGRREEPLLQVALESAQVRAPWPFPTDVADPRQCASC